LNITDSDIAAALTILSNDEIVCGCDDGSIIIFSSYGSPIKTLNAFKYIISLVSYPYDVIVSGSDDKKVRIWTIV
jgi:WD40 repeat protein